MTSSDHRSLLTDDRRFRRLGFFVVVAIFGGFGTWAFFAPLSSVRWPWV